MEHISVRVMILLILDAKEPVATNDPTVIEISKWAAKRLGGLLVEVDQAQNQVFK